MKYLNRILLAASLGTALLVGAVSAVAFTDRDAQGISDIFRKMNFYGGIGMIAIKNGECSPVSEIMEINKDAVGKFEIVKGDVLKRFFEKRPDYFRDDIVVLLAAYDKDLPLVHIAAFTKGENLSKEACFLGWARSPLEVEEFEAIVSGS